MVGRGGVSFTKMRTAEEGVDIWVGENNYSVLAIGILRCLLDIFIEMLRRYLTIRAQAYIYIFLDSSLTTGSLGSLCSSHTKYYKLFLAPHLFFFFFCIKLLPLSND